MARSKQQARKSKTKKKNLWQQDQGDGKCQDPRGTAYKDIVKENPSFEKYYKKQGFIPEEEWDSFMNALREDLPVVFRITGYKSQAEEMLKIIESKFFTKLSNVEVDGKTLEPPVSLPWYPNNLGWQVNTSRGAVRKLEPLKQLKEFLISETESGFISRQEAVSMIPPLLLDVQPHHKILDMCAAPGSKTAQLIELLHAKEDTVPEGFVVANDSNNKRCYLMIHQVKRLQSPCFMIMNHDATILPNLHLPTEEGMKRENVQYDRILADVPCSGDGTMRKNIDVWKKWAPCNAYNLHSIQKRILQRGLELLKVGGRIVYSTCSLNPIEDESVIAEFLRKCDGAIRLVDVKDHIPGLKYTQGLSSWSVISKDADAFFDSFEDVPPNQKSIIRPSMFPPTAEEAAKFNLSQCIRVLPHQQNTGGFFIAVLEKVKPMPWSSVQNEKEAKMEAAASGTKNGVSSTSESKDAAKEPPMKRQKKDMKPEKLSGFKEDPFIYLNSSDTKETWNEIKEFFEFGDDFPSSQLLVRCETGKKRTLYFTSKEIQTIVEQNAHRVKFVNLGVKLFGRVDNKSSRCPYRVMQEGISILYPYLSKRIIKLRGSDMVRLLTTENPFIDTLSEFAQQELHGLEAGSVVFEYEPGPEDSSPGESSPDLPKCDVRFSGWRGKMSVRPFVGRHEQDHVLRLFGQEVSADRKLSKDSRSTMGDGNQDSEDFVEQEDTIDNEKEDDTTDTIGQEDTKVEDDAMDREQPAT